MSAAPLCISRLNILGRLSVTGRALRGHSSACGENRPPDRSNRCIETSEKHYSRNEKLQTRLTANLEPDLVFLNRYTTRLTEDTARRAGSVHTSHVQTIRHHYPGSQTPSIVVLTAVTADSPRLS